MAVGVWSEREREREGKRGRERNIILKDLQTVRNDYLSPKWICPQIHSILFDRGFSKYDIS